MRRVRPIDGTDNGISLRLSQPDSAGSTATLSIGEAGDIVVVVTVVADPPLDAAAGGTVLVAQVHRL